MDDAPALGPAIAFVGVTSFDSASEFYGTTLGLPLEQDGPFALVATVGGTMLRITKLDAVDPADHTVAGWSVADIVTTVRALHSRGIEFARYEGMGQDDDGIWHAPGGDLIAWFLDPDGNNLSLTQFA